MLCTMPELQSLHLYSEGSYDHTLPPANSSSLPLDKGALKCKESNFYIVDLRIYTVILRCELHFTVYKVYSLYYF